MSGIARLAVGIEAELGRRLPRQRKTQRRKLALLVATMLSERSASLMDLAAALPRPAERTDMRYQWIARLLADPRLDGDAVMRPFAGEAILHAGAAGGTVVLLLDQSKVSARHQMLALSVRVGERALPLAWRGPGTPGGLGVTPRGGGGPPPPRAGAPRGRGAPPWGPPPPPPPPPRPPPPGGG